LDIEELRSSKVVDVPALTTVSNIVTPIGETTNKFIGIFPNNGEMYNSMSSYSLEVTYDVPIEKLSRFTVKLTDFTGRPVGIGSSNVCFILALNCLPEGQPIFRNELPEPISRPIVTRPAVTIPNKFLLFGLGVIALLIIIMVPKRVRQ
jgi:hypothetical protein